MLTVEIEHVDVDALETAAEQFSLDVEPTPHTLRLIQVPRLTESIGGPATCIEQRSLALPRYGQSGSSVCFTMLQDKFVQKQHFQQAKVPVGDFLEVSNAQQAEQAGNEFGYPLMLKSRRFAYDGKGNAVVQSAEGLENAVQQLGGYKHGLYAEKWTVFVKVCLSPACLPACLSRNVCLCISVSGCCVAALVPHAACKQDQRSHLVSYHCVWLESGYP